MKKLFAFAAAALLSANMFAAPAVVPTDADLAEYATGTYTMCIYNDGACNDIVLNGTYAGWPNDGAGCLQFTAVEGFAGWYVVTWEDATDPAAEGGVQAKPIQLDGSGNFNWDYQLGPDAELIRGNAELVSANNGTEVDIKNIQAGIVVIEVKSWKNNPCTAVYHNYTVTLISPDCNDDDYITPAISGGFNGWAQQALTMDELATATRSNAGLPGAVFTISFRGAEGSEYKFRSSEEWGAAWTNEIKMWDEEAQEWKAFNGGANFTLGEETTITYDLGDPDAYTWTNCEKPAPSFEGDFTLTFTNIAACEDFIPAVVGGFASCGWDLSKVVEIGDGTVTIHANSTDEFKIIDKATGDWTNGLSFPQQSFAAAGITETNLTVTIDCATYTWSNECPTPVIENLDPAKAHKFLENGRLVLVKNGKRYNAMGAQF